MKAKITISVVTILAASFLATPLFAQNQMPGQSKEPMGSGMMQGNKPSGMSGDDMNRMMADCDKMMKDKGMQMSGNMQQMMGQCSDMMKSQSTTPQGQKKQ